MQRRLIALSLLAGGGLLAAGCGGGGGGSASPEPEPNPNPNPGPDPDATGAFAYISRPNSGDISVHRVLASGELQSVAIVPAEAGTRSVAVHPSGRFAYAMNADAQTVSIHERDSVTGLLSLKSSKPLGGLGVPTHFLVHPSGGMAYVASAFRIDAYAVTGTGDLSFARNRTTSLLSLDVHPSGRFVLIADGARLVTPYDDLLNLTRAGVGTGSGGQPVDLAVSPSGAFLYVSSNNGSITVIGVDPATGIGQGSTHTVIEIGLGAGSIAIHPSGLFGYVAGLDEGLNADQHGVFVFDIEPGTGALTRRGFEPTGTEVLDLAISPSGRFIYAAHGQAGTVSGFSIHETSGALGKLGIPIEVGGHAASICLFGSDS
jgi:6-phosphogluconolactonase